MENLKNTITESKLDIEGNLILGDQTTYVSITDSSSLSSEKSLLQVEKITTQFIQASHILNNYQNSFEGLPNSHIQRNETKALYDWLQAPLTKNKKGIALLIGAPGSGKSVILKDLLVKLQTGNTPVLG